MDADFEAMGHSFDEAVVSRLVVEDPELEDARRRSTDEGLPEIQVSAAHGKLLELLCRLSGARRVLEVGTLGGYSTICLARGVGSAGVVVTLEIDPHHAAVATRNIEHAHLADRVRVMVGPALDSLATLIADEVAPFDLFFIDADKKSNRAYVEHALRLSRPGSLLYVDNVVRGGAVIDPADQSADVEGTRAMFDLLADDPRLDSTAVQTLGSKGYDGFALARVTG